MTTKLAGRLCIDTHIHVYPHYDVSRLLAAARRNFLRQTADGDGVQYALALVEREGTDVFGDWLAGERLPPDVRATALDATALRLNFADGFALLVLAGRQVACRERIELLGLGCRRVVPDGVSLPEAVEQLRAAGALPVLAWGIGKWLFGRAKTVTELLEKFAPPELLLGDSSLRPVGWPEPLIMRRARKEGRRILAGSDPLPPQSEEVQAGRYCSLLELDPAGLQDSNLSAYIKDALRNPALPLRSVGKRSSPLEFLRRRG